MFSPFSRKITYESISKSTKGLPVDSGQMKVNDHWDGWPTASPRSRRPVPELPLSFFLLPFFLERIFILFNLQLRVTNEWATSDARRDGYRKNTGSIALYTSALCIYPTPMNWQPDRCSGVTLILGCTYLILKENTISMKHYEIPMNMNS